MEEILCAQVKVHYHVLNKSMHLEQFLALGLLIHKLTPNHRSLPGTVLYPLGIYIQPR